jgi:hypothetical protein
MMLGITEVSMNHWKIFCMEDRYPGLWSIWFKRQVVAVGWNKKWGFQLDGKGKENPRSWSIARACLNKLAPGDWVIVQLRNHRVGRIGEVIRKQCGDDEWEPTVDRSSEEPDGEQGRLIHVRWNLAVGPMNPEQVVQLPEGTSVGNVRSTIGSIPQKTFEQIGQVMGNQGNWVSLVPPFAFERSLSDYIVAFPHRLEDGLRSFPSEKAREHVFGDRTRSDVLLIDRHENLVVVECKQSGPTVGHLAQLRGYMEKAKHLAHGKQVRGFLVHGGARRVSAEVAKMSEESPPVELVQFEVQVGFARSG